MRRVAAERSSAEERARSRPSYLSHDPLPSKKQTQKDAKRRISRTTRHIQDAATCTNKRAGTKAAQRLRSKPVPDLGGSRGKEKTQTLSSRVLLFLIQWVLISTNNLCVYTHHNGPPSMPKPTKSPHICPAPMLRSIIYTTNYSSLTSTRRNPTMRTPTRPSNRSDPTPIITLISSPLNYLPSRAPHTSSPPNCLCAHTKPTTYPFPPPLTPSNYSHNHHPTWSALPSLRRTPASTNAPHRTPRSQLRCSPYQSTPPTPPSPKHKHNKVNKGTRTHQQETKQKQDQKYDTTHLVSLPPAEHTPHQAPPPAAMQNPSLPNLHHPRNTLPFQIKQCDHTQLTPRQNAPPNPQKATMLHQYTPSTYPSNQKPQRADSHNRPKPIATPLHTPTAETALPPTIPTYKQPHSSNTYIAKTPPPHTTPTTPDSPNPNPDPKQRNNVTKTKLPQTSPKLNAGHHRRPGIYTSTPYHSKKRDKHPTKKCPSPPPKRIATHLHPQPADLSPHQPNPQIHPQIPHPPTHFLTHLHHSLSSPTQPPHTAPSPSPSMASKDTLMKPDTRLEIDLRNRSRRTHSSGTEDRHPLPIAETTPGLHNEKLDSVDHHSNGLALATSTKTLTGTLLAPKRATSETLRRGGAETGANGTLGSGQGGVVTDGTRGPGQGGVETGRVKGPNTRTGAESENG